MARAGMVEASTADGGVTWQAAVFGSCGHVFHSEVDWDEPDQAIAYGDTLLERACGQCADELVATRVTGGEA